MKMKNEKKINNKDFNLKCKKQQLKQQKKYV